MIQSNRIAMAVAVATVAVSESRRQGCRNKEKRDDEGRISMRLTF